MMVKYKNIQTKRGQLEMDKIDIIARRILGWKLNSWDKWYDFEAGKMIHESEFQPERNLDHAMIIVKRLEKFGFIFIQNGETEVCFNQICAKGDTLAQAITNAAYELADNTPIAEEWL